MTVVSRIFPSFLQPRIGVGSVLLFFFMLFNLDPNFSSIQLADNTNYTHLDCLEDIYHFTLFQHNENIVLEMISVQFINCISVSICFTFKT